MFRTSPASTHALQHRRFRWRGAVGGVILIPIAVATILSTPLVAADSWWGLAIRTAAWACFVAGVGFRFWATLYIGGRKDAELDLPQSVVYRFAPARCRHGSLPGKSDVLPGNRCRCRRLSADDRSRGRGRAPRAPRTGVRGVRAARPQVLALAARLLHPRARQRPHAIALERMRARIPLDLGASTRRRALAPSRPRLVADVLPQALTPQPCA